MWEKFLPYPATPLLPREAIPPGGRLVAGKAGVAHLWEATFRVGVDAGRTEGAALVVGSEVVAGSALAVVLGTCWLLKRLAK